MRRSPANPSGFAIETITQLEPRHGGGFELNPAQLSTWGHELVGPIPRPSVRTSEEVLDEAGLAPLTKPAVATAMAETIERG